MSSDRDQIAAAKRLIAITSKLEKVKAERRQIDDTKPQYGRLAKEKRHYGKQKQKPDDISINDVLSLGDKSATKLSFPKPKLKLYHPDLPVVYGEILFSPYNTRPDQQYSRKMYNVHERLVEVKASGQRLNQLDESERPYNIKEMTAKFINDICLYNPKFTLDTGPGLDLTEDDIQLLNQLAWDDDLSIGSGNTEPKSQINSVSGRNSVSSKASINSNGSWLMKVSAARGGHSTYRRKILKQLKQRKQQITSSSLHTKTDALLDKLRRDSVDDDYDFEFEEPNDETGNYYAEEQFEELDETQRLKPGGIAAEEEYAQNETAETVSFQSETPPNVEALESTSPSRSHEGDIGGEFIADFKKSEEFVSLPVESLMETIESSPSMRDRPPSKDKDDSPSTHTSREASFSDEVLGFEDIDREDKDKEDKEDKDQENAQRPGIAELAVRRMEEKEEEKEDGVRGNEVEVEQEVKVKVEVKVKADKDYTPSFSGKLAVDFNMRRRRRTSYYRPCHYRL